MIKLESELKLLFWASILWNYFDFDFERRLKNIICEQKSFKVLFLDIWFELEKKSELFLTQYFSGKYLFKNNLEWIL